jgi:hypothetical protein
VQIFGCIDTLLIILYQPHQADHTQILEVLKFKSILSTHVGPPNLHQFFERLQRTHLANTLTQHSVILFHDKIQETLAKRGNKHFKLDQGHQCCQGKPPRFFPLFLKLLKLERQLQVTIPFAVAAV